VGLQLKYKFTENSGDVKKLKNPNDDLIEPASKKVKLDDSRKTSILKYSSVQLPVTAFLDYLENQHLSKFVENCQTLSESCLKMDN
jgi:hypothetical protein